MAEDSRGLPVRDGERWHNWTGRPLVSARLVAAASVPGVPGAPRPGAADDLRRLGGMS